MKIRFSLPVWALLAGVSVAFLSLNSVANNDAPVATEQAIDDAQMNADSADLNLTEGTTDLHRRWGWGRGWGWGGWGGWGGWYGGWGYPYYGLYSSWLYPYAYGGWYW